MMEEIDQSLLGKVTGGTSQPGDSYDWAQKVIEKGEYKAIPGYKGIVLQAFHQCPGCGYTMSNHIGGYTGGYCTQCFRKAQEIIAGKIE
jgi:hypothetical protein